LTSCSSTRYGTSALERPTGKTVAPNYAAGNNRRRSDEILVTGLVWIVSMSLIRFISFF
jgi:hypothetical protein